MFLDIAVALRGDRGLELILAVLDRQSAENCGRSSGRSRIGTAIACCAVKTACIAVALRGDRGLEHGLIAACGAQSFDCGRSSGRSRIGTRTSQPRSRLHSIRNCGRSSGRSRIGTPIRLVDLWIAPIAVALRGDRGLEQGPCYLTIGLLGLRSLFGAIEDWNFMII